MRLAVAVNELLSRGFKLSLAVMTRAQKDGKCLEPALTNLSAGMKAGTHSLASAAGLVGLPFSVRRTEGVEEICTNGEVSLSLPDDSYPQYVAKASKRLCEAREGRQPGRRPEATTKYKGNDANGKYVPADFFGITIISPPYGKGEKKIAASTLNSYNQLGHAQQTLRLGFARQGMINDSGIPRLAFLPQDSLHLTLADLIYADKYTRFLQGKPEEEQFLTRLQELLPQAVSYSRGQPLHFILAGAIIKKQTIGALVLPQSEADYKALLEFRRIIYDDSALQELGLVKNGEFKGHVSLAYFPVEPDLDKTCEVIKDLNAGHFPEGRGFPITVDCADVRGFSNMESFEPLFASAKFWKP